MNRQSLQGVAITTMTLIVFGLIWEAGVSYFGVKPIVLPPPSTILRELFSELPWYMGHAWFTLIVTLGGFALAVVIGAQDPAGFRQVAKGHIDVAFGVEEPDRADIAAARFLLDAPIAIAEQGPLAPVALEAQPAILLVIHIGAEVARGARMRPDGGMGGEVVHAVFAQDQTGRFQPGDHSSSSGSGACVGWEAGAGSPRWL